MGATTVHNLRTEQRCCGDVYCGRAGHGEDGYFGNPYSLREHGDAALPLYAVYLLERLCEDSVFRQRVAMLHGRRLLCFCAPKPCHASFLAVAADWLSTNSFYVLGVDAAKEALRGLFDGVLAAQRGLADGKAVLRVVTLWRPWDYAISRLEEPLAKRVENRGSPAPYACPWYMAVRGGQTRQELGESWEPSAGEWPAGLVSSVAEVVAHETPGEGDLLDVWRSPDQWGWRLGRVATLPEPVAWPPRVKDRQPGDRRSMQGFVALKPELYEYDATLLAALRSAWAGKYGGAP